MKPFRDRTAAGQALAELLLEYTNNAQVLVLGLPRGGVPVAYEIAKRLQVPLDICLVRKLGVPSHRELAFGAIALDQVRVLNPDVIDWMKLSPAVIDEVTQQEQTELMRRDRLYRGERPFPEIKDRIIILVDDGIATGSTIRAAIEVLKKQHPQQIIIAVPVAPPSTCQELETEVDRVVSCEVPESLQSISLWYENFEQTSDQEVQQLLAEV